MASELYVKETDTFTVFVELNKNGDTTVYCVTDNGVVSIDNDWWWVSVYDFKGTQQILDMHDYRLTSDQTDLTFFWAVKKSGETGKSLDECFYNHPQYEESASLEAFRIAETREYPLVESWINGD